MDIVNWDYLKNRGLLVRNTLESPQDLVLVAANTTYKKRGDLFQTYAVPASALGGGGGTSLTLETNGTPNGDQTLLNLRDTGGSGIGGVILEDGGSGTVFVSLDPSVVKASVIKSVDLVYPVAPVGGAWRDITDLIFNVESGKTYAFKFDIFFRITTANPQNYGTSWSVSGNVTFSALNVFSEWPGSSATTNIISGHQTYDGALITGTTASLATQPMAKATITGTITPTSDGAITARSFAEGGANLVILAGSSGEYLVTA